jgi:protein-tyrosine-phosphatase
MAMGFFSRLAGDAAVAWSVGLEPQGELNPAAIAVMAERGVDISGGYPKPWTDEVIQAADVIITMGCGEAPHTCLVVDTKTGTLRPGRSKPASTTRSPRQCAGPHPASLSSRDITTEMAGVPDLMSRLT